MTPNEHIKAAQRTKTGLKIAINEGNENLLHATIGISTEAGELLDAVKKHLFYGKPLDVVNLQEELGDLYWYMSVLCEWLGCTHEELMERNIDKLKVRYPEKFTSEAATNRNLEDERKVLEHRAGKSLCTRCWMDKNSCIC